MKNLLSPNKHRLVTILFQSNVIEMFFDRSVSVSVEARTEALVDAITEV